ncbi:MAG: hypothetical protein IJ898_02635 [Prevotella sp.]|nr:hypothetical protein [Prevotella sp.]
MFIAYITGNLNDEGYARGQMRSMLYISIFFFVVTMRLNVILKAVWINGLIMAVVTLILFFLSQLGGIFLAAIYDYCLASDNYTMASNRNFLGYTVNGLYYKAGSLIIFSFIYNLYQYKGPFKLFFTIILYLSLMVAGSRTPMLVQTMILLVYLYDKNIIGKFLTRVSALVLLGMLVMLTYLLATQENEKSNEVKYDNFESYVEDIGDKGHPIWGAGLGSEFYAKGRGVKLSYTELSYMDILRMYGLPVGLCFIFLFFAPCFWLWKYFPRSQFLKRYCLGYVLFLILSGTNPLLLGSIGLTALSLFMAIVNKTSQMEIQKEELLLEEGLTESEEEETEPLVVDNCLLR